jgi:hypothetical protein
MPHRYPSRQAKSDKSLQTDQNVANYSTIRMTL